MSDTGSAAGYRAAATLPVRVELRRQLRRRRTHLTLGFLVVLPLLLLLAFQVGGEGDGTSLIDLATMGGANFTVFTLLSSVGFLLVVVVALFFGDTVASEASWSSLRYLLAIPVPRGRLLRQKAIVASVLSGLALLLLPGVSLLVGVLAYGTGDLVSPSGQAMPFGTALSRLALAVLYLVVHFAWVAGLATLLSVSTDAPLGAVGGTVLVSIVSQILDSISALGELRNYLPSHYGSSWLGVMSNPIDWSLLAAGALSGVVYAAVFGVLACRAFAAKDITS